MQIYAYYALNHIMQVILKNTLRRSFKKVLFHRFRRLEFANDHWRILAFETYAIEKNEYIAIYIKIMYFLRPSPNEYHSLSSLSRQISFSSISSFFVDWDYSAMYFRRTLDISAITTYIQTTYVLYVLAKVYKLNKIALILSQSKPYLLLSHTRIWNHIGTGISRTISTCFP